jgi:hypothetical protein
VLTFGGQVLAHERGLGVGGGVGHEGSGYRGPQVRVSGLEFGVWGNGLLDSRRID